MLVSDLKPLARWANGVALRYRDTRLSFDPFESDPLFLQLFVTHAHRDHADGFLFPVPKKYSTRETLRLFEADSGRQVGNWKQVRCGERLHVGDVQVKAHDAGHVLGSVQYEVITDEGNLVYASHVGVDERLTSRAAEVIGCDLLIVETSLASPSYILPRREAVIADIVNWSVDCINDRRVPAFQVDPIGNAQELIQIFNTWTEIPVIVHPRIARINKVYEEAGITLQYEDASTEKATQALEDCRCLLIVPPRFDTMRYGNFRLASVSSRETRIVEGDRRFFPLGDQADFNQLLGFIRECKPKAVLTFYGPSELFANIVSRRFKIPARSLFAGFRPKKRIAPRLDEKRLGELQETLVRSMRHIGGIFAKTDLISFGLMNGFRLEEIEEALVRLTNRGVVKYSAIVDGYLLPEGD